MCTGRSPFQGDTTGELLIAIVQQVPITPARLNPDVPVGLARIIDRCLEKDRELRYQHAGEIRTELKRLQRTSAEFVDAAFPEWKIEPLAHASSGVRPLEGAKPGPGTMESEPAKPASPRRWLLPLSGLVVVAVALLAFLLARPLPAPKVANYVQLTHDGHPKGLVGTDGSRLYLSAAGGFNNTSIGIMQISASGGAPERLPVASDAILPLDVSQDGTKLLAEDVPPPGEAATF